MAKKKRKKKKQPKPQQALDDEDEGDWEPSAPGRGNEAEEVPASDSEDYVNEVLSELGEPSGMGRIYDDDYDD